MIPQVYLIGAPKCGTTSLATHLSNHPQIHMGLLKEPNYWSTDLPHFAKREGLDSLEAYLRLYRNAKEGQLLLDGSTHYLCSKKAAGNILEQNPNARIIVCIRPQWELAHAWHMQMFNAGYESLESFEDAWERNNSNEPASELSPEPILSDYKYVASIGHQLQHWCNIFPSSQLLVIPIEELRNDTRGVYQKCLSFLQLEDDGQDSFQQENQSFSSRSQVVSRLIRAPHIRRLINASASCLPSSVVKLGRKSLRDLIYKKSTRSPLSSAMFAKLRSEFRNDYNLLCATFPDLKLTWYDEE